MNATLIAFKHNIITGLNTNIMGSFTVVITVMKKYYFTFRVNWKIYWCDNVYSLYFLSGTSLSGSDFRLKVIFSS